MNFNNINIPLILRPLLFIIGALGFLYPLETSVSDNTFLFCLKSNIKPLVIDKSNAPNININNEELNNYFKDNGITTIEKWIPQATEMDHDGDIYLNRIYRVYINEDFRMNIQSIIMDINNLSIVQYAENEYLRKPTYSPNDPMADIQCSLNSVKAKNAWDFWDIPNGVVPQGREVLLASVDTGVDYTHPDIQLNSWINQAEIPEWMAEAGLDDDGDGYIEASEVILFLENEFMDVNNDGVINLRDMVAEGSPFVDSVDNDGNGYIDDFIGWDSSGYYGTDDNDPFPKEGVANNSTWAHGTHVAGILAATTDNDLGIASTAYNAKFISVKCSRENQSGEPGISDGYAGILYAAKAGYYAGTFTIINNSWGGGGYSASENSTINTAHDTYGAIITCAAGNGLDDTWAEEYSSHYPSSYDNSVSICAMGCSYNWGNWATYHYTVDLAAPGESIHSAIIGSGYEAWDGSSMASPNAASCFGLLKSYYPTWDNNQLEERMYASADRIVYELSPEYETCNGFSGDDCFGHGMVDVYKAIGMNFSPNIMVDSSYVQVISDDDGVLNPGESAYLKVSLENEIGWVNASALVASISTDNPDVSITNDVVIYGSLPAGTSAYPPDDDFEFLLNEDIALGEIEFIIDIVAIGGDSYQYTNSLSVDIDVTLFQQGFPFDTNSEIKSTPIIVDLDNDGDKELVVGDYSGMIRIIQDGVELDNDTFPYDTGNQIWGSISSADLDLDGLTDFVVSSKSDFIYIFDINGLKAQYNAERYLIGTPVIGNFDTDDNLEIAVGGYGSSSTNPLYVINHDGTDVIGYPYVVGEKIKSGAAVADMDGDGVDDIVFGTDDENLHVILAAGVPAPNFPINLGGDIRSEPAILDIGDEKIILTGCKDGNLYAINYSDGSLRFIVPTGDDIYTTPSFDGNTIYFGSDDGNIYAVDYNGNIMDGFPLNLNDKLIGSIVFSDINGDGLTNLIAATNAGNLYAYNQNLESLDYFPINYQFPFASSPQIFDLDLDGDLEVIVGSTGDLVIIDVKNESSENNYWSLYKGSLSRTGYHINEGSSGDCLTPELGNINCDEVIDILDIINIVNMIIIGFDTFSDYQLWSADLNSDQIIDILDIISVINIVMDN